MGNFGDVYVRLDAYGIRAFGPGETAGGLLFVDLAPGADPTGIREVDLAIRAADAIVVRGGGAAVDTLQASIGRLPHDLPPIARLMQRPGEPFELEGDVATNDVLVRLRDVEVEALLRWGGAIWEPRHFHYRLPSGDHVGSFVRVGHAIRDPHDADVLASWLLPDLHDETAIVIDSGTLSAVVASAQRMAAEAGLATGMTAALENYPHTFVDVVRVLEHVEPPTANVIALLSVNSTGGARDRLALALARRELAERSAIHVVVDRAWQPGRVGGESWLRLAGDAEVHSPDACALCADRDRARVVPIHPRSYDELLPSHVRRLVPRTDDARANAELWELCDAADAIGVQDESDVQVRDRMAIRIDLERLLARATFGEAVSERLTALGVEPADVVLVVAHEAAKNDFNAFWERIAPSVSTTGTYVEYPDREPWPPALKETVATAESVRVFALGSVSGASLQHGLVGAQSARLRTGRPAPTAVVVHARPSNRRDWRMLAHSFEDKLTTVWLSYLPERSPLTEEALTLEGVDAGPLSEAAEKFRDRRLAFCEGAKPPRTPLFWGSRLKDTVTPHSIFGEGLRSRAVYVAVGAAMMRARVELEDETVPELRVFELSAISRAYYDPLILAAVMRWLGPFEPDWGVGTVAAIDVVGSIVSRTKSMGLEGLPVLLCEFLLAAAQGKLDAQATQLLLAEADVLSKATPKGHRPHWLPALELAIGLAAGGSGGA